MKIKSLLNDNYFSNEQINIIKSTTADEILKIFQDEVQYKRDLEDDKFEDVYFYDLKHRENLILKWFYKNILVLDIFTLDQDIFEKRTFSIPNPSLYFSTKVNVKETITATEYIYNKPLQNLKHFLENSRIETTYFFGTLKNLYSSIDIDEEIEFSSEAFIEAFEKSTISTQTIFCEDLFHYIQKIYEKE